MGFSLVPNIGMRFTFHVPEERDHEKSAQEH